MDIFPEHELEPTLHDKVVSGQHIAAVATEKRVNKNVAVTIAVRVGYMVTRIGIPPFVLAHIGLLSWGIWSTAFLLVQYLGITNSGLSNVYIKYVAEFDARKEYRKANELVSTGLTFTLPICAAIFALIVIFWPALAHFVNLPPEHAHDGKEAFLIVFAVFLSSLSLQAFPDVLNGMQEIAMVQWFSLISFLVETAAIVLLVGMGRGVRGLAEAYLARQIVYFGLCIFYNYYKLKWLHISPRLFSRSALREVLHFGGIVQLQTLLAVFFAAPERFIGMRMLGMEAAGLFDLAKKWPSSTSTVPMSFFSALLPAASNLHAHSQGDSRERNIRELYLRGARQSNIVGAYFSALMAMLPGSIMLVWLGKKVSDASALGSGGGAMTPIQFHDAVILFALFNVAMQIHMLTGTGTSILRGIGRIYEEFWYALPNLFFLAITLTVAHSLQHRWTILGIGFAVASATLLAATVFLIRAHHVLRIGNLAYFREVLWPGIAPYLVAAVFTIPVSRLVAHQNRMAGAGILLCSGFLYTLLLALVMDWVILHQSERNQWRNVVHRALRMLPQLS